jgi:hypothetical protein
MTANDLKNKWRREDEDQRRSDLRYILSTPSGRRFVMHLITISGTYSMFRNLNPHDMAVASGRRDMGLDIISQANHADSEAVLRATSERNTLIAERNKQIDNANNQTQETP